jgi:hypothetical protein
MAAYHEKEDDTPMLCPVCFDEWVDHWNEQWSEYYYAIGYGQKYEPSRTARPLDSLRYSVLNFALR